MSDMLEYLKWRGDILFSELPLNPVDALIFSTLCYIRFEGIVPEVPQRWITLKEAAEEFFAREEHENLVRVPEDLELLHAAARSPRFSRVGLSFYQSVLVPAQETQFAAMTCYLEDGSAYLAFRGTDNSLVGWKEDFNMTFLESIPAQRMAQGYTQAFAAVSGAPMRLGGHSKGGNLAVYAAAKSDPTIQERIIEVYNQDGPGFTERMLLDPGYLAMVPKIRTYVPQSSVFGMMLEHEGDYTVVRSRETGLMQHDPHSWEVMGAGFITAEAVTESSHFVDRTLKSWLATMTIPERNEFVDTVFELLGTGETSQVNQVLRPQNIRTYLKTLQNDDKMRRLIATELAGLVRSAVNAQKSLE